MNSKNAKFNNEERITFFIEAKLTALEMENLQHETQGVEYETDLTIEGKEAETTELIEGSYYTTVKDGEIMEQAIKDFLEKTNKVFIVTMSY